MSTAIAPQKGRSFAPREHGAYGQLGFPLLTALLLGRPAISAALLALAAVAVFAAHEPALVAFGKRGVRAQEVHGRHARRVFALWICGAVALGTLALALAPREARAASLAPAVLGMALVAFVAADREKTLAGELTAAAALSSPCVPVALAAGAAPAVAWGAWVAWLVALGAPTVAVRAAILEHRSRGRFRVVACAGVAALAAAGAVVLGARVWVDAPLVVAALVVALRPPPTRSMMRIGWALVALSAATVVLVVVAFRR
jgi:YwiC-like protein